MRRLPCLCCLLLSATLLPSLRGQQSSPASSAPPPREEASKPKDKKVWTGDDLRALRTHADEYAEQKVALEQAASAREGTAPGVASPKKEIPLTPDGYFPPKTIEEAQSRIAETQDEIRGQEEVIERTRQQYAKEPNDLIRQDLKKTLDRQTADLNEAQLELSLLRSGLNELIKSKTQQSPRPAQAGSDTQAPASAPQP
jgi:hypothetical protein